MEVDEDIIVLDYHSPGKGNTRNMGTIETIDVSDYPSKKRFKDVYKKSLCKDNKALTDFINKCILLDPSNGMESVINNILLKAYVNADTEYKNSEKFRRVTTKAFQRLIDDPANKYSTISDVVETLKLHTQTPAKPAPPPEKKRVNFITLSTKVSVKPNDTNRKRHAIQSSSKPCPPKKSKPEVIALDDDDIIPIDDKVNEGSTSNQSNNLEKKPKSKSDNSNLVSDETIEIQSSQEAKIVEKTSNNVIENEQSTNIINNENFMAKSQENKQWNNNEHEKENLGSNEHLNDNMLLVPQKEVMVRLEKAKLKIKMKEQSKLPEEMTDLEKARRVQTIEAKIEKCKKTIARLELQEVTDDSANSPYHKCDRLQASIVKLYKELCTLVGEEVPKRRKIQLHIKEGVPQGPIKRLEKFLNKITDKDGETPFPDFGDVIGCVEKSNEADGLGWSKAKIMKEAQAIFTYCGRALQKKRQRREWKHLRAIANPEEFEADPADNDLELQARLEANRQLANQREAEVFSKFTSMEPIIEPTASTSFEMEEPSEHDSSSDEEPMEQPQSHQTEAEVKESNNNENTSNDIGTESVVVKQEPEEELVKVQYQGDISLVIDISDFESDDENGVLTF